MLGKIMRPFVLDKKKIKHELQHMGVIKTKNIKYFQINSKYAQLIEKQQHLQSAIEELEKQKMNPIQIFKICLYLHGALQNFQKLREPQIILNFLSQLLKQNDALFSIKQNPQDVIQKNHVKYLTSITSSPVETFNIVGQQKEKYNLSNFFGERIVGPYIAYLLKFCSEIEFIHKSRSSSYHYGIEECFISLNLMRSATKAIKNLPKYIRLQTNSENQLIEAMLYYIDGDVKAFQRKIKKFVHPNLVKLQKNYINTIQEVQFANKQFQVKMDNFQSFFELVKQIDTIRQQLITNLYFNHHLSTKLNVIPRVGDWINLHNSEYDFLFEITNNTRKKQRKNINLFHNRNLSGQI